MPKNYKVNLPLIEEVHVLLEKYLGTIQKYGMLLWFERGTEIVVDCMAFQGNVVVRG